MSATTAAPRLLEIYRTKIVPKWVTEKKAKNAADVPQLKKIAINMGLGEAVANPKVIEHAVEDLRKITGQQPQVTRARKSEANFKIRENLAIGARVTLRGARMYEFLDRFVNFVLPRTRDFKGVPRKSFDGRGNYSLGITEQLIFPELSIDEVDQVRGMDISFVTTAGDDERAASLLQDFGMPFRKK